LVFWPFDQVDEYDLDEVLTGSELGLAVGYNVAVEENFETRAFGDLQATVHKVIMTMTGSAQGVTVTNLEWHIGDFGNFQMLVGYYFGEGDDAFAFEVTDLELR